MEGNDAIDKLDDRYANSRMHYLKSHIKTKMMTDVILQTMCQRRQAKGNTAVNRCWMRISHKSVEKQRMFMEHCQFIEDLDATYTTLLHYHRLMELPNATTITTIRTITTISIMSHVTNLILRIVINSVRGSTVHEAAHVQYTRLLLYSTRGCSCTVHEAAPVQYTRLILYSTRGCSCTVHEAAPVKYGFIPLQRN